ncbi:M23 family metallopeptidase [Sphingomonas sp. PL-96]|uniref:M23 family metallopeptidase n=1 Tax=Sphingomonas sp. PL-96 TaxID=2887201 RepID=UPI001E2FCF51|nr:M23 family metallopeptidase [Sphingomonas sp. PL-96]MCC2976957.1 M23 family metallopeptidase [Sphingomonas sp. PL-96]
MTISNVVSANAAIAQRFRRFFTFRDLAADGQTRRRSGGAARTQAMVMAFAALTLGSGYGAANAAVDPAVAAGPAEAVGGPYEPVSTAEAATMTAASSEADSQFRNLFMTWKKLDTTEQAAIAIPSLQPIDDMKLSSNFGVRSDPFRGTAAMHAGIDLPGPIGTPVYATADGIVGRAQRAGGYGNLIELNHGKGIQTRYGHLSKILVGENTRVRRGQLIGLMGSTGRSTGSHLHYEVRINGAAVNPVPYLQAGDQLLAAQDRAARNRQLGVGGPAN